MAMSDYFEGQPQPDVCKACQACCQWVGIPPTWPNDDDANWRDLPEEYRQQVLDRVEVVNRDHGGLGNVNWPCLFVSPDGDGCMIYELAPAACTSWLAGVQGRAACVMFRQGRTKPEIDYMLHEATEEEAQAYLDAAMEG